MYHDELPVGDQSGRAKIKYPYIIVHGVVDLGIACDADYEDKSLVGNHGENVVNLTLYIMTRQQQRIYGQTYVMH